MFGNKFTRHTTAFLSIALASVLLFPAARAGAQVQTWMLLGLIGLAAVLTLTTK
ncbi:MAG: hypothetical protein Kow002_19340 [Anaerolineales bacterium]